MLMLHFKIIVQVLLSGYCYNIRVIFIKQDQRQQIYAKSAPTLTVKPFQAKNNRNQNNYVLTPVMKTK